MSQLPERIGPYRVERALGQGGMGAVYAARDESLGRSVALKVIHDGEWAEDVRRRFQREGEALAALQHPNVVGIHGAGEHRGQPYLVLDLIEGTSLLDRLARGPLAEQEALALVATLADAMAYVHGQGILHRDLKPANVLLDGNGTPYLTDFGLARAPGADRERLTRTGDVLGTPNTMAPEQARGGSVDERTDVYGLGAVLYGALTGQSPFPGAALAVLYDVVHKPPPSPRDLVPGIGRSAEAVCLRCLSKAPEDRYPSASELAQDLRRALAGDTVRRQRRSGPTAHTALFGLAGASVLLAVATLLWFLGTDPQPPRRPPPVATAPLAPPPSDPTPKPKARTPGWAGSWLRVQELRAREKEHRGKKDGLSREEWGRLFQELEAAADDALASGGGDRFQRLTLVRMRMHARYRGNKRETTREDALAVLEQAQTIGFASDPTPEERDREPILARTQAVALHALNVLGGSDSFEDVRRWARLLLLVLKTDWQVNYQLARAELQLARKEQATTRLEGLERAGRYFEVASKHVADDPGANKPLVWRAHRGWLREYATALRRADRGEEACHAASRWRTAASRGVEERHALFCSGLIFLKLDRFSRAIEFADLLIERHPNSPDGYDLRGHAHWKRSQESGYQRKRRQLLDSARAAARDLGKAVERGAGHPDREEWRFELNEVRLFLFDVTSNRKRLDVVREASEALIAQENYPFKANGYLLRGMVHLKEREADEAEKAFREGLKHEPARRHEALRLLLQNFDR